VKATERHVIRNQTFRNWSSLVNCCDSLWQKHKQFGVHCDAVCYV